MTKRLPIEGLPDERPVCPWCGRKLVPVTIDRRTKRSGDVGDFASGDVIARKFHRWKGYAELFDRLQCALEFALASYRAGYRMRGRR